MEQIRRIMRPTDVPDTGKTLLDSFARETTSISIAFFFQVCCAICYGTTLESLADAWSSLTDLLSFRSDPDKETQGWGENDRGVSFTFGADVVAKVSFAAPLLERRRILSSFSIDTTWISFVELIK